jgi:uncharacterized phage protein gp47/JayE
MVDFGIDETGINVKGLNEIAEDINTSFKAAFGESYNTEPEEVLNIVRDIFSENYESAWQAITAIVDNLDEDKAEGSHLENIGAFAGLIRLPATKSKILSVALFGTATTVIPTGTQFSVSGSPTSVFETLNDVTLIAGTDEVQTITFSGTPTSGSFAINFEDQVTSLINWNDTNADVQTALRALSNLSAVTVTGDFATGFVVTFAGADGKMNLDLMTTSSNTLDDGGPVTITVTETTPGVFQGTVDVNAISTGPTIANKRTLTVIDTPVSGLDSVLNLNDAIVGQSLESDTDFRIRIKANKQISDIAIPEGIKSAILKLNEDATKTSLISVVIQKNNLDTTVNGLPPHSIRAVVREAGDTTTREQEIIDAIYLSAGAGIETFGSVSGNHIDSDGFTQPVKFERPTAVDIHIEIDLTRGTSYPANGDTQLTNAIVEHGNSLGTGVDVIVHPVLDAVINTIQGIEDVEIRIGTAASPTLDNNIPIDDGSGGTVEVSSWDISRVTIGTI